VAQALGLNLRVPYPSRFSRRGRFLIEFPSSVDRIDEDQAVLEVRIEGKTAPGLVLGMGHQAALHGIPVQLLISLL
jgi:hypothetical protein